MVREIGIISLDAHSQLVSGGILHYAAIQIKRSGSGSVEAPLVTVGVVVSS